MLRERFEIIANDLNLTEEQKSKAETIFHPLAVKQLQNLDTPADHASALSEFNKILTPEQRVHLYNILLERWRAEGPTTQPNPAAESKLPVATQPSMNPE
jgi:Spy/CpxP family protein refolding chaperone